MHETLTTHTHTPSCMIRRPRDGGDASQRQCSVRLYCGRAPDLTDKRFRSLLGNAVAVQFSESELLPSSTIIVRKTGRRGPGQSNSGTYVLGQGSSGPDPESMKHRNLLSDLRKPPSVSTAPGPSLKQSPGQGISRNPQDPPTRLTPEPGTPDP